MDHRGSLVGGAAAGLAVDFVIYPLDTIKTRRQAIGGLVANGGFHGLYRGAASVVICTIPSAAVFFTAYESIKVALPGPGKAWNHMLASAIAETASCAILVPAEVVKSKIQVGKHTGESSISLFRKMFSKGEYRSLYRGFSSMIGRNIPFTTLQFTLYEKFKKRRLDALQQTKISGLQASWMAAIAGSIAAAVTTPLDVVKTRMMVSKDGRLGFLDTMRDILQHEGASGLLKGWVIRSGWTGLGMSIYLGSYEYVKQKF